jgi:tRNA (Thr-GGU) A37 N-methylase
LLVTPFLDDAKRGLFATRSPARPNPIGFSIVRLIRIVQQILYVEDIDIVDRTPLLDIKPVVPEFDTREVDRIGWLEKKAANVKKTVDDGRFGSQ